MERLEDDSDVPAAKPRQFVLAEPADIRTSHIDRTAVGALEASHHHQ